MSVINQMLNQLEQRGVRAKGEQGMVRVVPPARRSFSRLAWAFALTLAVGIAMWQWTKPHDRNVSAVNVAAKAMQGLPPSTGNAPVAGELDKPALQHQPSLLAAPVSAVLGTSAPASRLSFELSTVPAPAARSDQAPDKPADRAQDRPYSVQAGSTSSGQAQMDDVAAEVPKPARPKARTKARPQPVRNIASNKKDAEQAPEGMMPMKQVSATQQADAEFRKSVALMQQGHIAEALAGYQAALKLDPGLDAARQTLVALLVEEKRGPEAERVLQERLKSKPDHAGFIMLLARLQVERGAVAEATATLEKGLPYAKTQADYQAFLAALLQRQNRNDEAVAHYRIALQLAPNNGLWQMGYGISLQAMQRNADAKAAFQRALDTNTLSPDLQAFVRQKLKEF
jgi:MSHA biogenesis protein MshN